MAPTIPTARLQSESSHHYLQIQREVPPPGLAQLGPAPAGRGRCLWSTDIDPERPAEENGIKRVNTIRSWSMAIRGERCRCARGCWSGRVGGKQAVLLNVKTIKGTPFVALRIGQR
jgi:hypothetical protein